MSLYISSHQIGKGTSDDPLYVPILLESPEAKLKHRIFRPDYEFSKILLDSYEIQNRSDQEIPYPLIPSGCISLVFMLGWVVSYANILGASTLPAELRVPPQETAFCVRIRPGGFGCFSTLSASDLTNHIIPLENCLHHTAELLTELRRGESFHERNVILHRHLNTMGAGQFTPMALVSRCVDLIQRSQGIMKVLELAETVGCSERYLNRVFQNHVGISPKLYCELIQLQSSLKIIISTKPKSLLNTAVTFGYFDQTHMNRSYRKFLDCTASDMRYISQKDISLHDTASAL